MAGIMTDEEKTLLRMHINALERLERAMTAMPEEMEKKAVKFKEMMLKEERGKCITCGRPR